LKGSRVRGFEGSRGRRTIPVVLTGLAAALASTAAAEPRTDYILHCQGCHGPDGGGAPGAVPSFFGVGKFLLVDGGREYLVRVPGASQSELSDARVAEVLNWIVRELGGKQVPSGFRPYTEEEVARIRRPPLTDVAGVRRRLVQQIEALERPVP
jgi:mono/diheme cytochrome c family protein